MNIYPCFGILSLGISKIQFVKLNLSKPTHILYITMAALSTAAKFHSGTDCMVSKVKIITLFKDKVCQKFCFRRIL